jgi:hypothetical protein
VRQERRDAPASDRRLFEETPKRKRTPKSKHAPLQLLKLSLPAYGLSVPSPVLSLFFGWERSFEDDGLAKNRICRVGAQTSGDDVEF